MEISQSAPLPQIHSFECNRFLNALNPIKPLSVLTLSTLTLRSRDPQARARRGPPTPLSGCCLRAYPRKANRFGNRLAPASGGCH